MVNDLLANVSSPIRQAIMQRRKAAGERALAEAAARRATGADAAPAPTEIDGRSGPEPVRYGDWEIKGLATDF